MLTQQGNRRRAVEHLGGAMAVAIQVRHQHGSPGEGVALGFQCLAKGAVGAPVNDLQLGQTTFQLTQLREKPAEGATPVKDQP